MIKATALAGILVLLIAFLLGACTSNESFSSPSSSQAGAAVPGEKTPDDQRFAPGAMGSSNVRW